MVRTYTPKAIDTSNVQLPRDLEELLERLAENNHDLWAQKRIDEGWRYGPRRNVFGCLPFVRGLAAMRQVARRAGQSPGPFDRSRRSYRRRGYFAEGRIAPDEPSPLTL